MDKKHLDKRIRIYYVVIAVLVTVLCAESLWLLTRQASEQEDATVYTDLNSMISVVKSCDDENPHTTISYEDIGYKMPDEYRGNVIGDSVEYYGLSEVYIKVNGKWYKFEDALRDGLVSLEHIVAQAQEDYRNGLCYQEYYTEDGVTRFLYEYVHFEIVIINDAFISFDGEPYWVNTFLISRPNYDVTGDMSFGYFLEDGTWVNLIAKDWGIELSVGDAEPTGITIICDQFGGVESGELYVDEYKLEKWNGTEWENLEHPDAWMDTWISLLNRYPGPIPIRKENKTEIIIDWYKYFGALEEGKYRFTLDIREGYPVLEDNNKYTIEFELQ